MRLRLAPGLAKCRYGKSKNEHAAKDAERLAQYSIVSRQVIDFPWFDSRQS